MLLIAGLRHDVDSPLLLRLVEYPALVLVAGEGSVLFKTPNFALPDDMQSEALLEKGPNGRKACDRYDVFKVSMFARLTPKKEIYRPAAYNAPWY